MLGKKKNENLPSTDSSKKDGKIGGFFKRIGKFFKKHIKLVIVLVIIAAIVIYARYSMNKAKKMLEEQANQPVTSTVEQMDLQQSVSVTGNLEAVDSAKVTSTIGGSLTGIKVEKVNYKEGDYVEAGTVVVEFDGDDYDRKIAELNVSNNISDKETAVNISELEIKITDAQKAIADTQEKRDKKQKWLDDNKKIYDNLKDAYDQYEKIGKLPGSAEESRWLSQSAIAAGLAEPVSIQGYENVRDVEIKQYDDTIRNNENLIISYQNSIELAQLKQNYAQNYTQIDEKDKVYESKDKTHVAAPISGYIITMNVEEGNNYSQGNTVFTIADTSAFEVTATVNEYDIANIKEGLPAIVKFEATGEEQFKGEVAYVSLASESSINSNTAAAAASSSSGTVASYKVKIKLNDKDERLRVGMTAKASVILDEVSNAICVPYDCVQQSDEDDSFFVTAIDEDGNKKEIPVTKGLESDYYVQVKGDGLEKGMTVEAVISDAPSTNIMDYMYME